MTANIWSPQPDTVTQANAQGLLKEEPLTAVAGQRVFSLLTFAYAVGTGSVAVFQNGKKLTRGVDFIELSATQVLLLNAAAGGDTILIQGFVGITGTVSTDPQLRSDLVAQTGSNIVGFIRVGDVGAVARTLNAKASDIVSVLDFGAKGDGVADDTNAFVKMWATGKPWYVPYSSAGYLLTTANGLTVTSNGMCESQLIAPAGFAGTFIQILNPVYGQKLRIYGLRAYSTDVRPNPYTAAKTVGILVGPNGTYSGNTPCPGVTLYNCSATRFSIGLQISTFNVSVYSGIYNQCDHNVLIYSYDTTYNQVNDITLLEVQLDSAASTVSTPYALRIGTTGNGVYNASPGSGVNIRVEGCNFDGGFVYIDNVYGVNIQSCYYEQVSGYTSQLAAIVLGSAGAGNLRNVYIGKSWFTNFDWAIDVVNQVNNLTIDPNSYASIKYGAVRLGAAETQSFKYRNGTALGSTTWANGKAEVVTNFSGGIAIGQLTFTNIQIESEYLNAGAQFAPSQSATTSWYPNGATADGWRNTASSVGRFRSGAAVATAIAGTQAGSIFTFTTLSDALKFNGGDRVSTSAGGASFIKSVNYVTGTAVLDSSYTGAATISNNAPSFVGLLIGSGSPNGVVTAGPGCLYLNFAGGATATLYVKESGTGNTGWVAK